MRHHYLKQLTMKINMQTSYKLLLVFVALSIGGIFSSCTKLIEVLPVVGIGQSIAYSDSTSVEANVNGIYYKLQQSGSIYNSLYASTFPLLSDEAAIGSETYASILEFATNTITTTNNYAKNLWANNYQTIYQANSVIENIGTMTAPALRTVKKNQFLGEAKFLRAYCYFILTQYYGKVPLTTTTDWTVNGALPRSDTSIVNKFIVKELLDAETLLPSGYTAFSNSRTRACKEAAQALLAKVYLYRGQWANAETYATKLIGNSLFTMHTPGTIGNIAVVNSPESIWEIWASSASYSYENFTASSLIPYSSTIKPSVIPSATLINALFSESGDVRQTAYVAYSTAGGFYYVYKYRDASTGTDQSKILRLSEMYLVRAEARAKLNTADKLLGAAADVNVTRNAAGLPNTTATAQTNLLAAIAKERFIELCFEGDRWVDLLRTGTADAILGALKPSWKATAKLLPIPASEAGNNSNLLPNNPGY